MRSRRHLSIEQLAPHLLPDVPRDQTHPLVHWPTLFGNSNPVEIEVGFGKGLFLLKASAARPTVNFLGIEIDRKCQLYTATRLAKSPRPNVKLVCADARLFLEKSVSPGSVQTMHVYFPDPWWKQRHKKRRLFTAGFVSAVEQCLRPNGVFHIVTDVAEYFQVMMKQMVQAPAFQATEPPQAPEGRDDTDYLTHFERKFRREGRPIYRATFIKSALLA